VYLIDLFGQLAWSPDLILKADTLRMIQPNFFQIGQVVSVL
jgi:hypothetical protein